MQLTKLVNRFSLKRFGNTLSLIMLCMGLGSGLWVKSAQAQSYWLDIAGDSFRGISQPFGVDNGGQPIDPRQYVANIILVVLGFLGVMAILLIIYAGFMWMTAAGNKDKVDKAKQILVSSIVGLLIILASFAITVFVMKALTGSVTYNNTL